MNIPMVTDSWCTVPNAPRYLCGHVSDSTIGATQHTNPAARVSIQLARCRFPGLATSNAKILIYFFNGSNFIEQHSETVTV